MLDKWITHQVILLVVREFARFGRSTDWGILFADADRLVREAIPGEALDDLASDVVSSALAGLRIALQKSDQIEKLLTSLSEQKWEDAYKQLVAIITGEWTPVTTSDLRAVAGAQALAA